MDRYMALSAIAAAAIHGGVLFGIPRGDAPARVVKRQIHDVIYMVPLPIDPDPVIVPPDDGEAGPTKGVVRPVGAEHPTIGPTHFPIPLVPVPAIDPQRVIDRIPLGPPGVETGIGEINRGGVIPGSLLDTSPRTRAQPPPIYPFDKKRLGEEGEATVEFTVDESGRVVDARVTHASDRAFEAAALHALAKWRFEPGTRHGQIVRFRMVQTFTFRLNER